MAPDDFNGKNFLAELYRQTQGDMSAQVSMYEVGATLGLNKSEAGSLAESLMVDGLVELKTLAGAISITGDGLASLGITPVAPTTVTVDRARHFSDGLVATEQDRQMMAEIIRQIKDGISDHSASYDSLEELIIDLKTIELHMLSPRPKIMVLRALLNSIQAALVTAGVGKTASMLKALLA